MRSSDFYFLSSRRSSFSWVLHLQHTEKKKKKIGKPVCEIPIFYHLVVLRFRVGFATHTHTEKKEKRLGKYVQWNYCVQCTVFNSFRYIGVVWYTLISHNKRRDNNFRHQAVWKRTHLLSKHFCSSFDSTNITWYLLCCAEDANLLIPMVMVASH